MDDEHVGLTGVALRLASHRITKRAAIDIASHACERSGSH